MYGLFNSHKQVQNSDKTREKMVVLTRCFERKLNINAVFILAELNKTALTSGACAR